jgi:hypothetical protein
MVIGPEPAAIADPNARRLDRWKQIPTLAPLSS